jgi:hypothetical protein
MKLVFKNQHGEHEELDTDAYPVTARGGKGRRFTKGPIRASPVLLLHLLPGQSIDVTCPECNATRTVDGNGRLRQVYKACKGCRK